MTTPNRDQRSERPTPRLVITCELEELPVADLSADSVEDEIRLRRWLDRAGVRQRLHEHLEDVLDELGVAA